MNRLNEHMDRMQQTNWKLECCPNEDACESTIMLKYGGTEARFILQFRLIPFRPDYHYNSGDSD